MSETMASETQLPPAIRNILMDLLAKADLASVTPRNLRENLQAIQTAHSLAPPADESRHIPQDFDFVSNKKQINKIIKACYDEVAGSSSSQADGLDVKPASSQSTPAPLSSAATSPPPPKTTIPLGGGLALPGLGGVRGSHSSPPPPPATNGSSSSSRNKNTAGDAALAAKLQRQDSQASPATRGGTSLSSSTSNANGKKRKSKANADEIESDEDSDVEAAAPSAASKARSSAKRTKKSDGEKKPRAANPNNPFNRPVILSPAMAEICGGGEVSIGQSDCSQKLRRTDTFVIPDASSWSCQGIVGVCEGKRSPESK